MENFWNERYGHSQYAYGISPNEYLEKKLAKKKPGRALFPAEGEGRNAVYAAKLGWQVDAFDYSSAARKKALELAVSQNVKINYQISDYAGFKAEERQYDLVALIYAHTDPASRRILHQKVIEALKPKGRVILEAFSKKQLGKSSGGPKDINMLYSLEMLLDDFKSLKIVSGEEVTITLNEGLYHVGEASVVRLVAVK